MDNFHNKIEFHKKYQAELEKREQKKRMKKIAVGFSVAAVALTAVAVIGFKAYKGDLPLKFGRSIG